MVDIVNGIIKLTFINICVYKVILKIINYKENTANKNLCIIITSLIESIIYTLLLNNENAMLLIVCTYCIHGFVISRILKTKYVYSIVITLIVFVIVFLVYVVSIFVSAFILKIIYPMIKQDNVLILMGAIFIEYIIIKCSFLIRRFKNGISFLQNVNQIDSIGMIGFVFIGIALIIYNMLKKSNDFWFNTYLFIGIIIELICMTIWIKRKITTYYKQKLKERTIEELESEIKERDEEINKILEENKEIATINHKYSNRIKSLENFSHQIMSKPELVEKMETEFGEDFINFEKQINNVSEEYTKEIEDSIQHKNHLEKTGIFGIDNILEYMSNEAIKHNIKFNLKIHENIQYMIENIIDQSKLETLLGDHIKDAIIAINSSENTYKELLVEIGEIENCYQVCIYDTGIEFEINTLLNLGLKAITTHKLTGGSGIGFMTTFETLKATKASLIIEERHPIDDKDYTKAVRIKFDGKHEYRICSYRSKEIQNKNKDTRIIIE